MYNWLGDAICTRRQALGLSAAALSKEIGYSSSYVAKVESGKLEPSVRAFARLAVVLGLTGNEIAWLMRLIAAQEQADG